MGRWAISEREIELSVELVGGEVAGLEFRAETQIHVVCRQWLGVSSGKDVKLDWIRVWYLLATTTSASHDNV